jgi:hypothetical protein
LKVFATTAAPRIAKAIADAVLRPTMNWR